LLLKSLVLQGFKTFPDKTKLNFHDGITAVVGPNGSGKSNISDAILWVLGEQAVRALRCTKMEDVIFNGTPGRRPLGFAEVTLNIDNSSRKLPYDDDSVSVTRRYYRSGESEYLINNTQVRLKDINELFMDTGLGRDGYSIIGQGKIDSIVSARSEDRREIFEEAAGISRFRYRKEDAEHKLAQAQDNLLRLHDILSELESRIGPLKVQSEKAKEYLSLAGKKKELEIGLWLFDLNRSGQMLHEQENKILIAKNQYDESGKAVQELESQIEKTFQESNACAAEADKVRSKCASLEEGAVQKDGEVSVLQNDIRHNNENIGRIKEEVKQNSASGIDVQQEIAEKKSNLKERTEYIKEKDKTFNAGSVELEKLKSGVDETAGKIDAYSQKIAELTAKATDAKVAEVTAASTISEIELRLSSVRQSLAEKAKKKEETGKYAESYRQKLCAADEKIKSLANSVNGYKMRLDARIRRREEAKRKSDTANLDLQSQLRRVKLLEDLEQNMEGFLGSVKSVMKASEHGELSGIRGPVSRLIRVPEQYAVAMETALGASMQNIVVETEQGAKSAIAFLKRTNGGRATFLPVSSIRGRCLRESGFDSCRGYVGIASELCTYDEEYSGIVSFLLGRIVIAEDLDSASYIARLYGYRFRVVTMDGQVVNVGGSFTGGSKGRNSGLISRAAEIEKIKEQAEKLRIGAKAAAEASKKAADEVSASEADFSGSRGELSSAQEERVRLDAECRRSESELKSAARDIEALEKEAEKAEARLKVQRAEREKAKAQSESFQREAEKQKAELAAASGDREGLSRKCDEIAEKIRKIELDRLAARKDIQSFENSIREAEERGRSHQEKITALQEEIRTLNVSTENLQEKIKALAEEAKSMRDEAKKSSGTVEEMNQHRMELEKQSVQLRANEREKSDEKEKVNHDLALLEERKASLQKSYDSIISQLWKEYELTRREAEEQFSMKIGDRAKAEKQLETVKNQIKGLGSVNVGAVDEYKEVSGRYEFLKKQVSDVEKSRDELNKLIGNLTRQMKELFTERFQQINKNFGETFRDLFGGGKGSLSLTDPGDVLNSGIEISVQPPGKIVSHLEALSGGEKALVAIAIYFAIMKVNPPPFCVLDEIEAALDDVNVARFAAYLRRMTEHTQFILITHRRGSMEGADVLYGVTMQDEGVSKLLEMPVAQMEAKLGIKA
jgi:chromosome segregation protein